MTRRVTEGILGGMIEHQKIYERDSHMEYTVLTEHKARYFWRWTVTKFPKKNTSSQEGKLE
jgi:hypothetical protein